MEGGAKPGKMGATLGDQVKSLYVIAVWKWRWLMAERGRPTIYSEELADRICELIATTPRGIHYVCRENPDLPTVSTIMKWLCEKDKSYFSEGYARAKAAQADLMVEECIDIADDGVNDYYEKAFKDGETTVVADRELVARSTLRVNTRMKLAAQLKPFKYGDQSSITLKGDPKNPLQIDDVQRASRIAALLAAAEGRKAGGGEDDGADLV